MVFTSIMNDNTLCDALLGDHLGSSYVAPFTLFLHLWCVYWLFVYPWFDLQTQQSAAFKILRTRLKTVPPYSFSGEHFKQLSSGSSFSIMQHMSGMNINEDGDTSQDAGNSRNGINFSARLQQFEHMQHEHRLHAKEQALSRTSTPPPLTITVCRHKFIVSEIL